MNVVLIDENGPMEIEIPDDGMEDNKMRLDMIAGLARAALVAVLLGACAQVEQEPYLLDESEIRPLADYVEKETGWKIERLPPVLVSPVLISEMALRLGSPLIRGFYSPMRDVVVLDQYDSRQVYLRSILVHELVHVAQKRNKIEYPCHEAHESDAYRIQDKYARSQGVDLKFNWSRVNELSACSAPSKE